MLSKKSLIFAEGSKAWVISWCQQHCTGYGGWRILDEKGNVSYYIRKKLRFFPPNGCVLKEKMRYQRKHGILDLTHFKIIFIKKIWKINIFSEFRVNIQKKRFAPQCKKFSKCPDFLLTFGWLLADFWLTFITFFNWNGWLFAFYDLYKSILI